MAGVVVERVRVFIEREAREDLPVAPAVHALARAEPPELVEVARLLNDSYASRALDDAQREQLLTAHHARLTGLIAGDKTGVSALSAARLESYRLVRRETQGLFPGLRPDPSALQTQVERIAGQARANEAARGSPALNANTFDHALERLLGVNSGPDEIAETHAHVERTDGVDRVHLDAFDRAGFHVLAAHLVANGRALHVIELKATHGRNVQDLTVYHEQRMPGRGNKPLVAEALSEVVEAALANGFSSLSCVPATNEVAQLYAKMGFHADNGLEVAMYNEMTLDLTDARAVQQLVIVFGASRAAIRDVPKDVSAKMQAAGQALSPPNRTFGQFNFQRLPRRALRLDFTGVPTPTIE